MIAQGEGGLGHCVQCMLGKSLSLTKVDVTRLLLPLNVAPLPLFCVCPPHSGAKNPRTARGLGLNVPLAVMNITHTFSETSGTAFHQGRAISSALGKKAQASMW